MIESPTPRLLRGHVAAPLYVLSLPDIRDAEILATETVFQTADGDVVGRVGDIAVTAYGGERYPIPSDVFYGAYEVIGQIGKRMIARRLIHVRTAWPIISDDAEFDYGADRGVVSVARRGWLYKADEDDFGVINPEVKYRGHVEVGDVLEVNGVAWRERFDRINNGLLFLPPILTVLAVCSLGMAFNEAFPWKWPPQALAVCETALLLLAVALVATMRIRKWALKAAMSAGVSVAAEFQVAAELLGERESREFAQMALWRAAQSPRAKVTMCHSAESAQKAALIRERLGATLGQLDANAKRNEKWERIATVMEAMAVSVVLAINLALIFSAEVLFFDLHLLKLGAILLPSLIGAIHAYNFSKRTSDRAALLAEFIRQLTFAKGQLQALYGHEIEATADLCLARESTLRVLCKIVGQYCQEELRLAMAQRPTMPV